jgi:hypothetical protein
MWQVLPCELEPVSASLASLVGLPATFGEAAVDPHRHVEGVTAVVVGRPTKDRAVGG